MTISEGKMIQVNTEFCQSTKALRQILFVGLIQMQVLGHGSILARTIELSWGRIGCGVGQAA